MNLDEYAVMRAAEDHHWWYRALRDVIRLHWERHVAVPRPRLLDVGCGTGANLALLAPLSEPAGIDVAPEAVAACRERGLVATAVASAASLPFGPESFDVVLSCDVLGHRSLADRALPLREMARVLRPGGLVLLNLPAFQWLLSPHDEAYGQDHRFTRREAVLLLQAAGFEPVAASYWNTLPVPGSSGEQARAAAFRSGRVGSGGRGRPCGGGDAGRRSGPGVSSFAVGTTASWSFAVHRRAKAAP